MTKSSWKTTIIIITGAYKVGNVKGNVQIAQMRNSKLPLGAVSCSNMAPDELIARRGNLINDSR